MLLTCRPSSSSFFFFNDTATTEIYTLSLHDALPISTVARVDHVFHASHVDVRRLHDALHLRQDLPGRRVALRSEEHTSELQSQSNLVCRLLLEKKKKYDLAQSTASRTGSPSSPWSS